MSSDGSASACFDESAPSVARAYDYMLGGKEHYQADRDLVDQIAAVFPNPQQLALVNRQWMRRAVRFLARDAAIDQFLDLGSGLPTGDNVHQVVSREREDSAVVYVDHDPVVAAHGRALLEDQQWSWFVRADLADPDRLLSDETVNSVLDWERPVGLVQAATMHWVGEAADPWAVMRRYRNALPSGSVVALSHLHNPGGQHGDVAEDVARRATEAGMPVTFRSRGQIEALFDGFELFAPQVVPLAEWYPAGPVRFADPWDYLFLCGVARKL